MDIWSTEDLTGNTPDAARRNAELEGVESRVEILTGDARKLEFADGSVDVVVSVFCVHNIESAGEQQEERIDVGIAGYLLATKPL